MKILLLTPSALPAVSGNSVTVERIRSAMAARGHDVRVVDVSGWSDIRNRYLEFKPDLIHAYHAYKAGRILVPFLGEIAVPLVVTLPGTDVNYDVNEAEKVEVIRTILRRADRIVTHNPDMVRRIREIVPDIASKTVRLPKGGAVGNDPYALRRMLGIPPDAIVFFLPAGIRRIKRNLLAVDPLARLQGADFRIHYVLAGPVLEEDFAHDVIRIRQQHSWVHDAGVIPLACMGSAYGESDVVLNTSETEGMPNTLLEAMACRRPALASDIPGNRELVDDGVTGFLFKDADDFFEKARQLSSDPKLRERLGAAGYGRYRAEHHPDREAEALEGVYAAVTGRGTGPRP